MTDQVPSKDLSTFNAALVVIAKRRFTEANRCFSDGVCECDSCVAGQTLVEEIERLQRLLDARPPYYCKQCDCADCGNTRPATEPSKDEVWSDARIRDELRDYDPCLSQQHVERIFAQTLGLIERQQRDSGRDNDADYIELLRASDPVEALKRENERLKAENARITGEREGPHCSTCACGLAPEPPAECLTDERIEEFLGELDGYCDRSEVVRKWFGRAAQPPGDGQ
jgi:hypothetical protein